MKSTDQTKSGATADPASAPDGGKGLGAEICSALTADELGLLERLRERCRRVDFLMYVDVPAANWDVARALEKKGLVDLWSEIRCAKPLRTATFHWFQDPQNGPGSGPAIEDGTRPAAGGCSPGRERQEKADS